MVSAAGGPAGMAMTFPLAGTPGFGTTQVSALIKALEKERQAVLAKPDQPITSLVPSMPGPYRDQMIKGQYAFRKGLYSEAESSFKAAAQLSQDSPASLLALAHTYFASVTTNYALPAIYLRRVLKKVPELPLVNVHPRSFYGKAEDYSKDLTKLTKYLEAYPQSADALFVLGYMEWRDKKVAAAQKALSAALAHADKEELTEAIQTLLDGMDASGELRQFKTQEKMAEVVGYPTAGIRFALPAGFESEPLRESAKFVQASRGQGTDAQSFSALAFLVDKGVTPKAFLQFVTEHIQQKLAIRNLQLVEQAGVSFLDIEGHAQLVTFSHRGVESAAIAVCFIRDIGDPSKAAIAKDLRLAHLFVVEAAKAQIETVGPTIAAILETISLTDVRRPAELPLEIAGPAIEDLELGYSISQPKGWAAQHEETGLVMGRVDYLLGGIASPQLRIFAVTIGADWTAQSCAKRAIELQTEKGYEMQVLGHGPAKLAGAEGYQFIARKSYSTTPQERPKLQATLPAPVAPAASLPTVKAGTSYLEVARLVCLPGESGKQRLYALVLDCYDCQADKAETLMNQLAARFTVLEATRPLPPGPL